MIDDQSLHSLATYDHTDDVRCPPMEAVIARGVRLRQRRRALRVAGPLTALAVGAGMVVGATMVGNHDPVKDVEANEGPTTTAAVPSSLHPFGCLTDSLESTEVPAAEIPDSLRAIPTWTPDGIQVMWTRAASIGFTRGPCETASGEPSLVLRSGGGDDTIEATITLSGPFSGAGDEAGQVPTELRGSPATQLAPSNGSEGVTFTWTEPDGGYWILEGSGVDELTVRTAADALHLDATPPEGAPPASLDAVDVPAGFEVTWQATGLPRATTTPFHTWSVMLGDSGTTCDLLVGSYDPSAATAFAGTTGIAGDTLVSVVGQPGVWGSGSTISEPGETPRPVLMWQLNPETTARLDCTTADADGTHSLPLETQLQVAESMQLVAADDPRIPPIGG